MLRRSENNQAPVYPVPHSRSQLTKKAGRSFHWLCRAIHYSVLAILLFFISCNGQNQTASNARETNAPTLSPPANQQDQISFDSGVYCGLMDKEGVLWFGSRRNGVYRYDGKSFTNFSEEDGLCDQDISAILEDQAGNLWFGTPNGLCRYDRQHFAPIAIPFSDTSSLWLDKVYPIVNPNQVMSIQEDMNGMLWIGTNGAGVYRHDGKTFIQYLSKVGKVYEDGLQHNIVLSITKDLSGNLWFTSLSHAGLSRFDGEGFTHFTTENGLSDNFLRTSYLDQAGNIWVGTHGNRNGGLDRFDGTSFTNFHEKDGLCSNNVRGIYQDESGKFWLGSGRGNLCVYDGKTFQEFTNQAGHTFPNILFILSDSHNNIWFGGKNGLWRFDGTSVTDMTQAPSK